MQRNAEHEAGDGECDQPSHGEYDEDVYGDLEPRRRSKMQIEAEDGELGEAHVEESQYVGGNDKFTGIDYGRNGDVPDMFIYIDGELWSDGNSGVTPLEKN